MNFLMMLLALVAMVVMAAAAPIDDLAGHWTTTCDFVVPSSITTSFTMSTTWTATITLPSPVGVNTFTGSAIITMYGTLANSLPSATSTGLPTIDTAASSSVFPSASSQTVAPSFLPVEK
ncbi:MAG: hypothetical protein Q9172_006497, partial [Xanthocarpia lactea]